MNFLEFLFKKHKINIWNIGDKINPIQLTTHTGQEFVFNTKTCSKLLIFFFPNAWSDTSQEQILAMDRNYNRFLRFNIIPVCITTDTIASIKKWAKALSLQHIKILSDFWPHGYVTNSFGLLNRQRGCPDKYFVLIDDNLLLLLKNKIEQSNDFDINDIFNFLNDKYREENEA